MDCPTTNTLETTMEGTKPQGPEVPSSQQNAQPATKAVASGSLATFALEQSVMKNLIKAIFHDVTRAKATKFRLRPSAITTLHKFTEQHLTWVMTTAVEICKLEPPDQATLTDLHLRQAVAYVESIVSSRSAASVKREARARRTGDDEGLSESLAKMSSISQDIGISGPQANRDEDMEMHQ